MTPPDLHTLAKSDASVLPSVHVKTLGVRNKLISKLCQPSGSAVSPTAYRILCVRLPHNIVRSYLLRNEINTRYGRGASPYPTGTCTPKDTPGFARRDNDKHQVRRFLASPGCTG